MSQPPLQLETSFFSKVVIEASTEPPAGAEPNVATQVELGRHPDQESFWMVAVSVACDPGPENPAPYSIALQVHGVFRVPPTDESEEDVAQMVGVTGASILYSAAREYLLLCTSRGPWGSFQLPTVSFLGTRFSRREEAAGEAEEEEASP